MMLAQSEPPAMPVSERARSLLALLAFLALSYAASAIGSLFTSAGLDGWYDTLEKPTWTPPGWVIGAVWTVLYGLMGVAAWLVWREGGVGVQRVPLALFSGQLVLNVLWSVLFFGLQSPGGAFAGIVLLEIAILATMAAFWTVRPRAGALLLPYAAWVAFAGFLNYTIWRLNA